MTPSTDPVSQIFTVLRHPARRRILLTLDRQSEFEEMEFRPADFVPNNAEQERFHRELYQVHFPKLEDSGFIDWDRDRDRITHGPRFGELHPFLDLLEDAEEV